MPPGRLPGEVFRACPSGRRPPGRPRTRWRDYVSRLVWERLGIPPDELEEIMDETQTQIAWPSKLKIGAKSKKDPHIKVCGKRENVRDAKNRIMSVLDTKSNRVTLKMDVSHTEHSHVIGKGGNNIKRVMEETGCHIHFPDSNRNNQAEKSNQV
ncbi:Protein bicaudal C -like protein 1-B [Takifugu flavidus]|uniref:Protein bicaudal C-like protein 1-B n=1 Tax=Takifugu flavidus TaxID=433684 RepID=A0A5C6PJ40_9TELE|nr:Protein bicaudal C -like protein 1-B [Takifugu flavidus]